MAGRLSKPSTPLIAILFALITAPLAIAGDWRGPAPEKLPQVTVRYQGADKKILIVEGAGYRVVTRREPTEIISIEVGGKNLLTKPMVPGFVDKNGVRYLPQRSGVPRWKSYQGQSYKPARSAAARVNVWNAGPYYWDAHVLDIPLIPAEQAVKHPAKDGKVLKEWTFDKDATGWSEETNHCEAIRVVDGALQVEYKGNDPWFNGPEMNAKGPLAIHLRVRSKKGGNAMLYYATERQGYGGGTNIAFKVNDGWKWQDIRIPWYKGATLKRFRIDPPGNGGTMEIDRIAVRQVEKSVLKDSKVVRGEIVFHAFPERLNIEFRVDPEKTGVVPAKASWTFAPAGLKQSTAGDRPALTFGDARLLGQKGQTCDAGRLEAPLKASPASKNVPHCWWVLRPTDKAKAVADLFIDELSPLPAKNITVRNGRYLGYDAAAGLHTFEALTPGINFNDAYDNPNRRFAIHVGIKGDGKARRIQCKSISHTGILPATVLADENGFMLPVPVLSCKNFAGEREEPDDSAFGHAFFPIKLAADEEKKFQILHLFQNWGDHMLKQVSSIRFFHIYWHLSNGVSETTCFTIPAMKLNGVWVRVPDYRPYSGAFWKGQPQHDCQSWPGLLQYKSNAGDIRPVYEKTVFESITPNLAHFTMHFKSSDGAVRIKQTAMEIPQNDQMRTFLKIRYDWDKDVTIKGDARSAFRWLNVNDKRTPKSLVYVDAANKEVAEAIVPGKHQVLARPLGKTFPYVGTHGMPGNQGTTYYSSMALVRSYKARLGGKDTDRLFFSSQYDRRRGNYWLTSKDAQLQLKKGDFIEAEVMLVAHAEGTEPLVVPKRERIYYGTDGPAATVRTGKKLSDFPATVQADREVVSLTVKGGSRMTPVVAKGYDDWRVPLLWVNGRWMNQQAHGGDGYQVDPDGNGKYRFTFLIPQRQGHPRHVVVTRASCTTGISKVTDRSGYVELTTAAKEGTFKLKAPAVFGPGVNTITKGSPAISFTGAAKSVRQIPLSVAAKNGNATVTVKHYDEKKVMLETTGAATLHFDALAPDTAYQLTIDGKTQERRTVNKQRRLSVEVAAGKHTVSLSIK